MRKLLLVVGIIALFLGVNALADDAVPYKKAFPEHPENPGDMILDSGGPDEFGYIWIDSNEPDGPTYDWVDITGIGTPISLTDDDIGGPFDLGFDFSFYGETYSQFWVVSNGFGAVIEPPDPGSFIYYVNEPFPSPPADGLIPGAAIAPFWDDLNPDDGGVIYYYAGSDSFVVQWQEVPHYAGGGGTYTVEMILTADGRITYQYQAMTDVTNSATVGIQNEDGSIGLQVVYNQNYVENGLAVELSVPATEEIVYREDFDSGMGDWAGEWGLATAHYHSPPNSLADSPVGNYADYDTVVVELMTDIDLAGYVGARLEFWTKYDIELGFDYIYLDVSSDGGTNWIDLNTFNGEGADWHNFVADIGGFAGQSVRFRFTLESDAGYTVDGMYVDDFTVFGTDTDTSPPLILHEGPTDSTSVPGDFTAVAAITDPSGVESASLSYSVEGGDPVDVGPDSIVVDDYYFTIPAVEAGAHVEYFLTALDNVNNEGSSSTEHYVSGTVLFYDDGDGEFVYIYFEGNSCATRMTPDETAALVTGMLRLYTDINRPLDTVDVEVWADQGGIPGQSIVDPFAVWPMSTLEDPHAWTYVDFRGMGITVNDDFFLGYTYRSGWPVILGDSPARTNRSQVFNGAFWAEAGTEFYIRAIVDYGYLSVDEDNQIPSTFALQQNYPNPFNATTVLNFAVTQSGHVKLDVYNLLGQHVETLVDGRYEAGEYTISWNAGNLPSGVYFARLQSQERTESVKMMLLK